MLVCQVVRVELDSVVQARSGQADIEGSKRGNAEVEQYQQDIRIRYQD